MNIIISFFFALTALATTPITGKIAHSNLLTIEGMAKKKHYFLTTTMDFIQDEIKVELMHEICPPNPSGISCAAMPMQVGSYSAPIQSVEDGMCDTIVFKASNANPATQDSERTSIVVVDYANFSCLSIRPVPPSTTDLTYESVLNANEAPKTIKLHSENNSFIIL